MSVVDVTKMWSKSGGSANAQLSDPNFQSYSFTEGYQVLCDANDNPATVIGAAGIPLYGVRHESGLDAFVVDKRATPIGPFFWVVEVFYEGDTIITSSVDVRWGSVTTTEPIDRDWNGGAIVTANNEQVDGLSVDVADQVVVIRRRFSSINIAAVNPYRRSTNSDTFLGFLPGTARLTDYDAENSFTAGAANEGWTVTARIQFREPFAGTTPAQAWYKRWRHEGLMVRVDGVVRRALDNFGQDVTKPVLLKADGTQETDSEQAVFIHTQVYGSLPYSALGLV